jgi:hypothetical protein
MPNLLEDIRAYSGKYRKFFRNEEAEEEEASFAEIREASEWMSQAYHKKFLKWLNDQASKPLDTSSAHADLIKAVTRGETFKEVERYLSKLDESVKHELQQYKDGA